MANELTLARKGNVIRGTDGRKYVCTRDGFEVPDEYEIVAETPHADGDYSYLCTNPWCRCSQ